MGGIDKITIIGIVSSKILSEFEGKCFMANVREELKKKGRISAFKKSSSFPIIRRKF